MEPSKDWTCEERLAVVGLIAKEMFDQQDVFTLRMHYEWVRRLQFLVGATPEFLEVNRGNILSAAAPPKKL